MASEFQIGDHVSFYGGQGTVIDIESSGTEEVLQVLTKEGGRQPVKTSLPMVRKIEEATQDDLVNFLGGQARVISRQERNGAPDLLYLKTEDDDIKKVPADSEGLEPGLSIADRLQTGKFDDPVRFSLRERAARLSLAYRSDRFLSLSGNRIRIEPYQVDAAHEVLTSYEPRYLIGDEVGLGKTIEAGIIIEELIARGRAERVLIVTPAKLRDQWQREMREKFGREYVAYDRDYISSIDRPGQNVWAAEDQIVVSIDLAKQDDLLEQLRDLREPWNVAVFDEAHHLTARETSEGTRRVDRYRVGEAVAENSDALLLLTGTPHKGKPDQFYNLLRLLDPYRFQGPEDITPGKVDNLMVRRTKTDDSMVGSDGEPMFPGREIQTVPVELSPAERHLYEDLTEYISAVYTASAERDAHAAGFATVIYQKRLVSSIAAITQSLENRRDDLEDRVSISTSSVDQLHYVDDAETERDVLDQLIEAGKSIDIDSKGARLQEFVDEILAEDPDEKILVFTEYTDTLEYLHDEVLSGYRTARIDGSMSEERRREEIERFRNTADVMLATDAAREGINLQFAHIMVNYDLPWNPIRIDQRMGRLHRYGQEDTVRIFNLFIEDTRESDILQLLVGKLEQIENDLGMQSDVLGTILDDYDVEGAIMEAVTGECDSEAVIEDLDQAIEERKEAIEKIENEFLIQDKFDAEDHRQIRNLIDLSRQRPIGEDDIERLVREFCRELGGAAETSNYGTESDPELLHTIVVPDIIAMNNEEIRRQCSHITFSRSTALDNPNAELVSLNHPLVQCIIEYCLDGDWLDGQASALVAGDTERTPGILATYRLGYVSGDGKIPTEDYTRVYVDTNGEIHDDIPPVTGALPAQLATPHPQAYKMAEPMTELLETASSKASKGVQELVEEVQAEREEDVEIKERHARRYFTQRIRELEDRLEEYRKEQQDTDKDMKVAIDTTRAELEEVEQEWEEEQARLERERTVAPDEPELVNAAIVTDRFPAVALDRRTSWSPSELAEVLSTADDEALVYESQHTELEEITELERSPARVLRPASLGESITLEQTEIDGTSIWVDRQYTGGLPASEAITGFEKEIQRHLSAVSGEIASEVCVTEQPVDALAHDGTVLCNYCLGRADESAFWQIVGAREAVYADSETPPARRIREIIQLLEKGA